MMFRSAIRSAALAVGLAFGVAVPLSTFADEPAKGVGVAEAIQIKAKVESVDMSTRTVTLTGEDGKTLSVQVDPKVENLDKLKPGDIVTATYVVALAAHIVKPGDPAPAGETVVAESQPGEGTVVGRQVKTRVKINAVDTAANTVTLTGPKGNTETVAVKNPELQQKLKQLKPGDEVEITYTEAMALSVTPAGM